MFTIKATYRGQTRKATFQDHNTFPSYFAIRTQIFRWFPETQVFALSRLLFSPDALFSSHNILITKEVRSADDYAKSVRPYKDLKWPNALLRFMIVDTDSTPRVWPFDSRILQDTSTSPLGESYAPFSLPPLHAMEVDQTAGATPAQHSEIPLQHKSSMTSVSSCCSVAESKTEIKAMLDDFQLGLNRVLSSNLREPLVISPQNSRNSRNGAETSSNPWTALPKCSHCTNYIDPPDRGSSFRYDCVDCGYVCETCHLRSKDLCPKAGPGATFATRPLPSHPMTPRSRPASFVSLAPEPRSDGSPALTFGSSHPPVVHVGVMCDACNNTIHGVRHKCLDCRDYDLCTRCITTGYAERHNPFHEFYEIREPGRVVVHTVFSGEHQPTSAHNNEPTRSPLVVHSAECDLCDSAISGDRYKCAICPDFDLCSSCFTITDVQHPDHSFVKITKDEDIIHPNVKPRVMHSATCDACTKTIYGNRFKCTHPDCPDYDLCQNCEALPIAVHPTNHPMLKIKTPSTVIPTISLVGQSSSIHASGSTRSFTGPKTDEMIHGSETPPGVTRIATPTPVSAEIHISVPANDWLPSVSIPSPPKATNPFADIFCVPPPPLTQADTVGMAANAEREEFHRLIAELSGNSLPQSLSKTEADGPKADSQMGFSEIPTLMDSLFGPEMVLQRSNTLPGALPGLVYDEPPAPIQITSPIVPESADNVSDHHQPWDTLLPYNDSQEDDTQPSTEFATVRESLASLVRELPTLVPPPVAPSAETKMTVPRISLSAAFVEDVTVPDGQAFPPGAEFVKCWRLINDSGCEWPESTELIFVAGDPLSASASGGRVTAVPVGRTGPGETIDVWTGELKAPEVSGRYIGYWRLSADGELFGNSLWVDINVVEADSHHSSEESMAASSVIMPAASSAHSERVPSVIATTLSTQTHSLASTDDNLSDAGSDMSLISMPSSPSDDEVWHETRSTAPSNLSKDLTASAPGSSSASTSTAMGMDYVLLYDDESSDEERIL